MEKAISFTSDKHRILQILINLITNAKDAMVEAEVKDPVITIEFDSDDESILFRVRDNGIGIEQDKIDRIFQHGFTMKADGHGFGLHSSANAATEIGGSLTASSPGLGFGAVFELRLPRVKPKSLETSSKLSAV